MNCVACDQQASSLSILSSPTTVFTLAFCDVHAGPVAIGEARLPVPTIA